MTIISSSCKCKQYFKIAVKHSNIILKQWVSIGDKLKVLIIILWFIANIHTGKQNLISVQVCENKYVIFLTQAQGHLTILLLRSSILICYVILFTCVKQQLKIVVFYHHNTVYLVVYFQSPSFHPEVHIVIIIFYYSALTECSTRFYAEHQLDNTSPNCQNANGSYLMLQEYKRKLARVSLVRKELRSRIQSLPDLSRLPNVTGSHMHLPFAGDIYSED